MIVSKNSSSFVVAVWGEKNIVAMCICIISIELISYGFVEKFVHGQFEEAE